MAGQYQSALFNFGKPLYPLYEATRLAENKRLETRCSQYELRCQRATNVVVANALSSVKLKFHRDQFPRNFLADLLATRDCNPGLEFSIPGFGIVEFPIPGSRRD